MANGIYGLSPYKGFFARVLVLVLVEMIELFDSHNFQTVDQPENDEFILKMGATFPLVGTTRRRGDKIVGDRRPRFEHRRSRFRTRETPGRYHQIHCLF